MKELLQENFKIFDLFSHQCAVVTAGDMAHHNGCTIGWGSLGNIWSRNGSCGPIATVYIHPARYTCDFLKESDYFTVNFFPEENRKALGVMGTLSGRDCDKEKEAGLTPIPLGESVGYEQANLTFLCKKLYGHQFELDSLNEEIVTYYATRPTSFPPAEDGSVRAHYMFVGEIVGVIDKR